MRSMWGVQTIKRGLVSLVAAAMLFGQNGPAVLAGSDSEWVGDPFTITGRIVEADYEKITFVVVTSDVDGKEKPITIDMSGMEHFFREVGTGDVISIVIVAREYDTYLSLQEVSQGSYVNGETFGNLERFNGRNDSIKAHVGNTPEDDEALAKQHRDNKLRREKDEKKD